LPRTFIETLPFRQTINLRGRPGKEGATVTSRPGGAAILVLDSKTLEQQPMGPARAVKIRVRTWCALLDRCGLWA